MAYLLWKGSLEASDTVSGSFADSLITSSSITQHQEALEGVLRLGELQPTSIDMGMHVIRLSNNPTADNHAARKAYVDAADAALDVRLDSIEGGMAAGVIWQSAFSSLVELGSSLVEADIQYGWAYYISGTKDVMVVVPGEGDHRPDGWEEKGFLKIADFTELSNLVAQEATLARTNEGAIQTELSAYKVSNDAALAAETNRASDAESANSAAIAAEATARGSAIAAEASARGAADSLAAGDRQSIRDLLDTKEAALTATITANANTESVNHQTNVTALSTLETNLTAALNSESSSRASADSANSSAINNEQIRAQAAEATLTTNLAAEVTSRQEADSELQSSINSEASTARSAESANASAIAAEEARAQGVEAALQTAITNEGTARQAAVAGEAASRAAAIATLQGSVNDILSNTDADALDSLSEIVEAFQGADATLTEAITSALGTHSSELAAEAAIRETSDNAQQTALTSEVARATGVEAQLTQDILDEAARAISVEAGLSGQIAAEASARAAQDVSLGNQIAAEATRAQNAENDLAAGVDEGMGILEAGIRGTYEDGSLHGGTMKQLAEEAFQYRDSHQLGVQVQAFDETLAQLANAYHADDGEYSPVYYGDGYNPSAGNTAFDITGADYESDPSAVNLSAFATGIHAVWPGVSLTSVDLSGNDAHGQPILAYAPTFVDLAHVFGAPTGESSSSGDGEANQVYYRRVGLFNAPIQQPVNGMFLYDGVYQMNIDSAPKFNLMYTSGVPEGTTSMTVALPVMEDAYHHVGKVLVFKADALQNSTGAAVTVTLDAGSSSNIDGLQTKDMDHPWQNIHLLVTPEGWRIVG